MPRACPERSRKGGRRPGAGAPRGNMNALRTGRYSERFLRGALMIALLPEVRLIFAALRRQDENRYRQLFYEAVAAADRAAQLDPALAESIRDLIARRIESILRRGPTPAFFSEQSNNQTGRPACRQAGVPTR